MEIDMSNIVEDVSTDVLNISNLRKSYVDFDLDLDFTINKGEFLSILGPSGSGKSTILKLIAGFESVDAGDINLFGKNITNLDPAKRNMGIVFQDYILFPHLNVFDNISYGLHVRKESKTLIKNKVRNMLELLNLEGYEKRYPHTLSGGEQQRVAIARALVIDPDVFLLDEPFSSLDTNLRKKIRHEISMIQRELNITTIFITHNQEEALAISDKILLIRDGRCVQFGTPEQLYKTPVDEYSAKFIGDANIINNKVIRPENLNISIVKQSKRNEMSGAIKNIEYYGSYYMIYVQTPNYGILQSKVNNIKDFEIGDEVSLSYNNYA